MLRWKVLFFSSVPTRCEVVLKMSEGEKCSSSPVCHLVLLELCHDLVRKVSEGVKCSSSSVCHLVLTESCCDLVLTLSDDNNCHNSVADCWRRAIITFWHLQNKVTTRFCQNENKLADYWRRATFKTTPRHNNVLKWKDYFPSPYLERVKALWLNEVAYWWRRALFEFWRKQGGRLLKKSNFPRDTPS